MSLSLVGCALSDGNFVGVYWNDDGQLIIELFESAELTELAEAGGGRVWGKRSFVEGEGERKQPGRRNVKFLLELLLFFLFRDPRMSRWRLRVGGFIVTYLSLVMSVRVYRETASSSRWSAMWNFLVMYGRGKGSVKRGMKIGKFTALFKTCV